MDMHVQNRPQIFFAKVPAEQTPQLCNLSVQTNRKTKFKKYNTPCHVQPFLLSFLMSGSPTMNSLQSDIKYRKASDFLLQTK